MYKLSSYFAVLAALFSVGAPAFQYYEEPDPSPYLANVGAPPACDYIIDDNAKWASINSGSYRVYCVAPGDYTGATIPTLTADGTAQLPRWIRYYNGAVGDDVHPYHMAPSERATLKALTLSEANYWVIDRVHVDQAVGGTSHNILLTASDHNVFSRLLVTNGNNGITLYNGSDYNTVQSSVFDTSRNHQDGVALNINGWNYDGAHPVAVPKYNVLVSNEIVDWNDGMQTIGDVASYLRGEEENYEGTIVYNNDIYITSASYVNCTNPAGQAATPNPAGQCQCKENAFDIKSGSDSADNPLLIAHNRMWGWRPLPNNSTTAWQPPCYGPTGTNSSSATYIQHFYNRNVRIEGNIFFDAGDVALATQSWNTVFTGNLIHSPFNATDVSGFINLGLFVNEATPSALVISDNVISTLPDAANSEWLGFYVSSAGTGTFTNNTIIDGRTMHGTATGWTVFGNEYYNSSVPAWDAAPEVNVGSVAGTDWDNQFCTTIKRITNPTTQCFENALNAAAIPTEITVPANFRILD